MSDLSSGSRSCGSGFCISCRGRARTVDSRLWAQPAPQQAWGFQLTQGNPLRGSWEQPGDIDTPALSPYPFIPASPHLPLHPSFPTSETHRCSSHPVWELQVQGMSALYPLTLCLPSKYLISPLFYLLPPYSYRELGLDIEAQQGNTN